MKQNKTGFYALTQMMYWVIYCVISAFASYYLLDMGASNASVGVVLAVGSLISSVLQPLIGALTDRFAWAQPGRIIAVFALGEVLCSAGLLLIAGRSAAAVCVLYCAALTLMQTMQPAINTLSMKCLNAGYRLYFGPARAAGSFGYAAVSFALGRAVEHTGAGIIPMAAIAGTVLLALTMLFFPKFPCEGTLLPADGKRRKTGFLRKYPAFTVLLAGLVLVYYDHVLVNYFALQVMQSKGGGSAEMGTAVAVAAVAEIVMLLLFPVVRKRMKMTTMLRLSAVFFTIKAAGSLLVRGVMGYYLVQLLQMPAWGIICVALVYYVNEVIPPEDSAKGQAYAAAVYTVATIIGSLLGGRLIDSCGVTVMLITGLVTSVVGTGVVFIGTREKSRDRQ